MRYMVAEPSQYLAITGWRIDDVLLTKKALVMPGQLCTVFDISPAKYEFDVQAMSADKQPFILPVVFTIGPKEDVSGMLMTYAKLILSHDKKLNRVEELVQGAILGEMRALAASMIMEDVFKGTRQFMKKVSQKVQLELRQLGLHIYTANVKQPIDIKGQEYFSCLNEMRQNEKLDALLSKATADYELKVQEADFDLYKKQKEAEAVLYQQEKHAEASSYAGRREADAKLYAKRKEAEGLEAIANAQKACLETLLKPLGGNYGALKDYLMISGGLHKEIAWNSDDAVKALQLRLSGAESSGGLHKEMACNNSDAVKVLQPTISGAESDGAVKDIAGVDKITNMKQYIVGWLTNLWCGRLDAKERLIKLWYGHPADKEGLEIDGNNEDDDEEYTIDYINCR